MIKLLTTVNKTTWIGFLIALVASFIMAVTTHAQESPEEIAQKYGVTFPVSELGSCDSLASCRTYCEDPVNHQSCIDYAKAKGFHKEEPTQTDKDAILAAAKGELGCDSESACMALCNEPANFDKCSNFAQKNGLGGGHVQDPTKGELLDKASQVLGCNTPQACLNFCNDEANRTKCSEFAKQTGLRGGEQKLGPGGCTSEETCKTFCSDPQNYQICSGFGSGTGGQFKGPGGCDSEESCKAYCQNNPQECSSLGGPDGSPPPSYGPYPQPTGGGTGYDPATECTKQSGCSWTGASCQCSGSGTQPNYSPYPQPTPGSSYDPAVECTKQSGCSWTGSTCQCSSQSGSSGSPGTYSPAPTTESSTGSYTPPPDSGSYPSPSPAVQGVSVVRSFLQNILDWISQ